MATTIAVLALLTALLTLAVAALGAWKAFSAARTADETKGAVQQVSIQVDGRLTELLEITKKAAHAAGVVEGRDESNGN